MPRQAKPLSLPHLSHSDVRRKDGSVRRRWRVQKSGRTVWISSKLEPGGHEFLESYHDAIDQLSPGQLDSIAVVTRSMAWRKDEDTLVRLICDVFAGCRFSTTSVQEIQRTLNAIRDEFTQAGQAGADKANRTRSVLSKIWTEAVLRGFDDRNKVASTIKFKHKQISFDPWEDAEISKAMEVFRPELADLIALAVYTGQRRGDLIRMKWTDIRGNRILVTQSKTGTKLEIPIHPDLATRLTAIRTRAKIGETILINGHGKSWSAKGVDTALRRAYASAGLSKKLHGLRHTAAVMLDEAGCSLTETASITGHTDLRTLQGYIKKRRQGRKASAAMSKLLDFQASKTGTQDT